MERLTAEQINKVLSATLMDDIDFYDKYISNLPLNEQAKFFEEHPDFMENTGHGKKLNN